MLFCIYTVNTILTFKSCARHEFRGDIMKKLSLLFALTLPLLLSAKPVDSITAQKVAQTFLKVPKAKLKNQTILPFSAPKFAKQATQQITPEQQFYVYQNPDGGYVIISADDVAHPILGYSHTGQLDLDNMPDNMRWWLSEYDRQIRWAQENNVPQSEEISREWQHALTQTLDATPVVGPLVSTHWDQGYPFNYMCPKNSSSQQAITGCVATALSQVLRFWSWPEQGSASHSYDAGAFGNPSADFEHTTYDWNNMLPNYNPGDHEWTDAERDAVATLLYHCGVAVDMSYGADGSSSYNWKAAIAARSFFKFSDKTEQIKAANYSAANWLFLIKEHLNNRCPLMYGGSGNKGGHSFICDGYDSEDKLHFNWGWSGNCDGFYAVNAMNTPNGNYNDGHDAIINMYPQTFPAEDKITLRAKLPSDWNSTITAWVWPTGEAGSEVTLTPVDGWVSYETTDKVLNIIVKNGSGWNGDVNQTPDITIVRSTCLFISEKETGQTWKRDITFVNCAHPINLDIQLPAAWGNDPFSVWVWPHGGNGHWEALTPVDGKARLTVNSEELNAVIVKGIGHDDHWTGIGDNDKTNDISIRNDACVKVGDEASGVRSFLFQDCSSSHLITIKAKKPASWGNVISAWVWEDGQAGAWKTLQNNGDWYFFSQEAKRLNIIFVNGTDWNGDDNQTIDISTQQDACYILGNNGGKKSAILTDCSEAPDKPTDIDNVVQPANARTRKLIHQGQLLLLHNGEMYNAQGVRVE